jgi:hypothetical protein
MLVIDPQHALTDLARRTSVAPKDDAHLLLVGCVGSLGQALIHRLVGLHRFTRNTVLVREPMQRGLRSVGLHQVSGEIAVWPVLQGDAQTHAQAHAQADAAIVLFEAPKTYYGRENALWTPQPQQLVPLARWLVASGVRLLVVVMPHAQGKIPAALRAGLANLDEGALAALGFDTVLIVRSARKPDAPAHANWAARLAHSMLGIFGYMVPSSEQPVRPSKIAEFIDAAIRVAREGAAGVHIASSEHVWQSAQLAASERMAFVRLWLRGDSKDGVWPARRESNPRPTA